MMGFESYGGSTYGGGSSNLSALAPPFTVDRSIPKPFSATPLVDLGEPLNWLDTNPYNFNLPQPAQQLDPVPTSSFDQKSDLFEPKTYFPSYVSPPFHVPTFDEQSLPGLDHTAQWGVGSWGWEKGNPSQLSGSFYSKESNGSPSSIFKDHINLGVSIGNDEIVSELTPKKASFVMVLKEYQVVPTSFAKEMGLAEKLSTMIKNSEGRKWLLNTIVNAKSQVRLGVGWSQFVQENKLELGDTLLFQHIPNTGNVTNNRKETSEQM